MAQVFDLDKAKSMIAICALHFKPSHDYEPDVGFSVFQSALQRLISQYKVIDKRK
jgi:hypothetical protein